MYTEYDEDDVDKESVKNGDDDDINDVWVLKPVRSWRVRNDSPRC